MICERIDMVFNELFWTVMGSWAISEVVLATKNVIKIVKSGI